MYIYIHTCTYVYIIYLSIYLSICLSLYLSLSFFLSYLYIYLSIYLYLYLSLSLSRSLSFYIYIYIYIYKQLNTNISFKLKRNINIHITIYIYSYICICICICSFSCIYIFMYIYAHTHQEREPGERRFSFVNLERWAGTLRGEYAERSKKYDIIFRFNLKMEYNIVLNGISLNILGNMILYSIWASPRNIHFRIPHIGLARSIRPLHIHMCAPSNNSVLFAYVLQAPSLAARCLEKKTRRCFDCFCAPPPFLFPRVHPRLTRRLIRTSAPGRKNRVD